MRAWRTRRSPARRRHRAIDPLDDCRWVGAEPEQQNGEAGEGHDFRPDEGLIRLHDQRVVILSAAAMGLLRKEMVQTLGTDSARRLLLRFGFADGYHDAINMRDQFSWDDPLPSSACSISPCRRESSFRNRTSRS